MRFRSSSAAFITSLLASEVVAAVHHRHQAHHARDVINGRARLEVTDVVTVTEYVTVEWSDETTTTIPTTTTTSHTVTRKSSTSKTEIKYSTPLSSAPPKATVVPAAAAVPATTLTTVKTTATPVAAAAAVVPAVVSPVAAAAAAKPAATYTLSTSGSKRGVPYNSGDLAGKFSGSKVSWAYNWSPYSGGCPGDLEFVPMLWGAGPDYTNGWAAAAAAAIAAGSKHAVFYNEPDLAGQSDVGFVAAAAGYKQYMMPLAGKIALGSVAVTNGGAPMGATYLKNFIDACDGCQIDFVITHYYAAYDTFEYFKQHLNDIYQAGNGRPVWITEFQAFGSNDQQVAFLNQAIPWLESTSWIQRYAYFFAAEGYMVTGGALNEIGNTFANGS